MNQWQWPGFWVSMVIVTSAHANDSTGFVGTGGVEYVHNPNISMQSEDLFISKKQIRVDYKFKNLTARDITETILFPLPRVGSSRESDFADTEGLIQSFQVRQNGQLLKPAAHVRAFLPDPDAASDATAEYPVIDVTTALKACGLSDQELMLPWTQNQDIHKISAKMMQCNNPKVQTLLRSYDRGAEIYWEAQVVYSWQQTFNANTITHIQHQYRPLIGGSVALYPAEDEKTYCMDPSFKAGLRKAQAQHAPYSALSYILTTGANWAKPIADFKLTVERDAGELVSFCWDGKVQKISPTRFQMLKKNFLPKQDLNIIFVKKQFRVE
ncbi:DUF4424 family protein [Acinetobacter zhairhuonensis]|uniref:DUF4424 family protein n=1 Tax=Acinetobacter sp. A7.4 TaxID=2919921 RepID=UPI001F4E5C51|nr:DUF4424 family protein [Acinetobacter sp. A7.4]MCJ8160110.1 DUF4424 domain-containing protein [Acinetobacter sp. A7.4]